jgi:type II secretory pathway pseudopilin PulG
MQKFTKQNDKGFSTLIIVIVLGVIALSLTLAISTSSVWSIRANMNAKTSNITKSLVNACAEVALEKMRENNSYVGTDNVTLNGNTCSYTIIDAGGNTRSITISGAVNDITRKLFITTNDSDPITIISWREVP